jgi:hypothetical protein
VADGTRGITAKFRPWTDAERAVLRTRYVSDGPKKLAAELGRSVCAVQHAASRLSTLRKSRWSRRDDANLRDLWGTMSVARVAQSLGRTQATTYWRARKVGLPCGAVNGQEFLTHAAKRTGFCVSDLRSLLKSYGVGLLPSAARPTRARRHFHVVDPVDVDWAVEQWLAAEYVEPAARRRGIVGDTLRYWLRAARAAGFDIPAEPKRAKGRWRVNSELIDRVLAWRDSFETLSEAARRTSIDRETLRKRLVANGVPRTQAKPWYIEKATVDRVAAEPVTKRRAA